MLLKMFTDIIVKYILNLMNGTIIIEKIEC